MTERTMVAVRSALFNEGITGHFEITGVKPSKKEAVAQYKLGVRPEAGKTGYILKCPKVSAFVLAEIANNFSGANRVYAIGPKAIFTIDVTASGEKVISSMPRKRFAPLAWFGRVVKMLFKR